MKWNYKKLWKEWNKLKTDSKRWKWVIKHKNVALIHLDNDSTVMTLRGDNSKSEESEDCDECVDCGGCAMYGEFDHWVGWSDGVFVLLDVCGIDAESV